MNIRNFSRIPGSVDFRKYRDEAETIKIHKSYKNARLVIFNIGGNLV